MPIVQNVNNPKASMAFFLSNTTTPEAYLLVLPCFVQAGCQPIEAKEKAGWHGACFLRSESLGAGFRLLEDSRMKMIMAIIKPFKLDDVREALTRSASRA